jgi:hypothetical protein
MNKTQTLGKFSKLGIARQFSNHTIKISAIILGDDGLFWVVSLANMESLLKEGYELANY